MRENDPEQSKRGGKKLTAVGGGFILRHQKKSPETDGGEVVSSCECQKAEKKDEGGGDANTSLSVS